MGRGLEYTICYSLEGKEQGEAVTEVVRSSVGKHEKQCREG